MTVDSRRLLSVALASGSLLAAAPSTVVRAQLAEPFRFGLQDSLRIALENNLDLVSRRYAPEISEQDILIEDAIFDPALEASYIRAQNEQAATQASTVTGSESDTVEARVGKLFEHGGSYGVGIVSQRFLQTGPNVLAPESYFSGVSVDIFLPLLKGFGETETTELLELARNRLDISLADVENQAELTLERVEGAYWDVLAASEALRISRLALVRAQDLLKLNRRKVEVGTLAPIEITQAEAGVASQEEDLIVKEVALADAEDELLRLMAIPEDDPRWDSPLELTDRPVFEAQDVDVEAAIETALASRSDLDVVRRTLRASEISERAAKRRSRHQLDLIGSYRPQGSSLDELRVDPGLDTIPGTPDDVLVTVPAADLGDSISNIGDFEEYDWRAQLRYTLPFGRQADKARYARAQFLRQQSATDVSDQEQTVRVEVRKAARGVESGIKRIEAAEKNVQLQREKLEAEQKKFENGMSTSFEVLTFQNDLNDAELGEIQARLDYVKAVAALERAKGTLLEARGMTFAE
jgi:outer membrane protein TolC